uniref:Uncharacterized protein n=1 Tax=Anguilla anguilla TaxID=7936 RepID=A0A0E9SDJ0_ANGAN
MCQILTDDDDDNDQDDSYQSAPHLQNTEHHVIERQWLSVTSDKISTNTSLWRHTVTSLFKQLLELLGVHFLALGHKHPNGCTCHRKAGRGLSESSVKL